MTSSKSILIARVASLSALAFFIIASYALARPAVDSLFLQHYSSDDLPLVWFITAFFAAIVMAIYNRFNTRHSLLKLFGAASILCALFLILCLFGYQARIPGSVFLLYIWKEIYAVLLVEIFWSFADVVFSIKNARWIYGILLGMGSAGGFVGSVVIGPLAKNIGTFAALWWVFPILFLCWLISAIFAQFAGDPIPAPHQKRPHWSQSFQVVRKSRYLVPLLFLIAVVQISISLVDYQFNAILQVSYPDTDIRTDIALKSELKRHLNSDIISSYRESWRTMGALAACDLQKWVLEAEENLPVHVPYDAYGNRVDFIRTSEAWERYRVLSAQSGIVALGYDAALGDRARVVQAALLYLFSASSATFSCPLAMADAAARVLLDKAVPSLRDRLVPCLLSRDSKIAITSGQWMTERIGGSDVSQTETIATWKEKKGEEERYVLYGVKWFTSATTSEMALTLARVAMPSGLDGLTLFCVELKREESGKIDGIQVNRLKDKLGTKALPTAELTLDGVMATRIGEVGRGVAHISAMLNVTRYYNAVASASLMSLSTLLAQDYAKRRISFGKTIEEHPLHQTTLEQLEANSASAISLSLELASLLGKAEVGTATDLELKCLRALISIAKLLLGKQVVAHTSEALECFGGAGYIEDTGFPRLLRDAQVLPIWEGTTNVLSLDVLRAERKDGALSALLHSLSKRLENLSRHMPSDVSQMQALSARLNGVVEQFASKEIYEVEKVARKISMATGCLYEAILLGELAVRADTDERAGIRFHAFIENNLDKSLAFIG